MVNIATGASFSFNLWLSAQFINQFSFNFFFDVRHFDKRILNRLTAKTIIAGIMIPVSAHAALKPSVAV